MAGVPVLLAAVAPVCKLMDRVGGCWCLLLRGKRHQSLSPDSLPFQCCRSYICMPCCDIPCSRRWCIGCVWLWSVPGTAGNQVVLALQPTTLPTATPSTVYASLPADCTKYVLWGDVVRVPLGCVASSPPLEPSEVPGGGSGGLWLSLQCPALHDEDTVFVVGDDK